MAAETWPLKRVAELTGDVVIGGLHMIHERNARMTCGPIMPQGGVQVRKQTTLFSQPLHELFYLNHKLPKHTTQGDISGCSQEV